MNDKFRRLPFVKMHGAGNDYVYIDCTGYLSALEDCGELPELARAISDRHFGVGGDGLVIIFRDEECDFRMRMFNADGSEAQMCGNASRCIGKYVHDAGLTDKTTVTLRTLAGVKVLHLHVGDDGLVSTVTVDMGIPVTDPARVPCLFPGEVMKSEPVEAGGRTFLVTAVSMGNPHGVIFTDEELTDGLVLGYGPLLERHPVWPQKCNIEFVNVLSPERLRMRVWERGTGETLACGTGACATVVAAVINSLASRKVTVDVRGGSLTIEWNAETGHVLMTGPAVTVAKGEYLTGSSSAIPET